MAAAAAAAAAASPHGDISLLVMKKKCNANHISSRELKWVCSCMNNRALGARWR